MQTSKSPESDTTPSKKKLKQARLPFKLISEGSPTPVTPQTRKRKLSASEAESVSVTKLGKISKENEVIDLVVLSDEESKDAVTTENVEKTLNPLAKLVDTVWKKKQQKSKVSKKNKNNKKSSRDLTGDVEASGESATDTGDDRETGDCEMMEVDEPLPSKELNKGPESSNVPLDSEEDVKIVLEGCNSSSNDELKSNINFSDTQNSTEINEETPETNKRKTRSRTKVKDASESEKKSEPIPCTTEDTKEIEIVSTTHETNDKSTVTLDDTDGVESILKPSPIVVTPKRSSRNKAKVEQNKSPSNSKLNESVSSTSTTPKQSRSSSVTNSLDESVNESITDTKLTPKQLQKKLESAKKKEERDKEKIEREKKKQLEKDERAKQKQEKEDQRKREREEKEEVKRKEKEEKEEQKRKEREEKERQKDLEKKLREEKEEQKKKEKEEKDEQKKKEKEAREEEKRKKQEALELEKQEQELKKKKAAEAFVNFFVPKQKSETDQATVGPVSKTDMLSSFTIKVDMRLAPTVRTDLTNEKKQKLDDLLVDQSATESSLYLKKLKMGSHKPLASGKTWIITDKDDDDDVMIIEDELPPTDGGEITTCESAPREKLRPKLLRFIENRRPPYWGTWRKKSSVVKPRRPFGQDEKHLDYEVDSDEEWEEEQEGESIDGSAAGSDDEQDADEYEVDNEVFVPHGYLSDEEATMDEDDVLSLSPDAQKARLKVLEDEFESEMKKPTEKLKPRLYGLLWESIDGGKPENCVDAIWNYFGKLSMVMNDPTPFLYPSNNVDETEKKKVKKKKVVGDDGEQTSPKNDKKKKSKKSTSDEKDSKKPKVDPKKNTPEVKKNQPGINMFLTKFKST